MRTLPLIACCGLAAAAQAQTAIFSVVLTPGVPGNNTLVNGTVRVTWAATGGLGFAGGAFRLRLDGLDVSNVVTPSNSNGGVNSETTAQRVGVPASQLPPGAGTVSDSWTSGRRPKRAYLADASDPSSIQSGGGFRFPPNGTGPTDLHYSVEQQSGVTYLTGRNGAGVENRIEFAQIPPAIQTDPLFFEPSASFDLFKFQIRTPSSGAGPLTFTPDVLSASIYITAGGGQVTPQVSVVPGVLVYVPSSAAAAPLALAFSAAALRRRRRA
jgi:hypothetical protein